MNDSFFEMSLKDVRENTCFNETSDKTMVENLAKKEILSKTSTMHGEWLKVSEDKVKEIYNKYCNFYLIQQLYLKYLKIILMKVKIISKGFWH
jgi:CTP-dependent riboflavin kinase